MKSAQGRSTASWRPALATFGAVSLSILLVGALVSPLIAGLTERAYLGLVQDVNERQARSMAAFLRSRLAAGASEEEAIRDFQAVTAGSDVDRGYVCLIEQSDASYLSHPNLDQLGMDIKPGALFEPVGGTQDQAPWSRFIQSGVTGEGNLTYGTRMAEERVYFTTVAGTDWTISTHENLSRIQEELGRLRRGLLIGFLGLSLLVALPASVSARGVSQWREGQIQRRGELERRLLEEEDARKSLELEQARELQVSMSPRVLPERPEVEVAARMLTATEVGGDFYDLHEREDGSLLVAVGDATGHGLQSGMVVVAVKALFAYSSEADDLVDSARRMAGALRAMRLGRLHMAFALARLTGRRLEVVGAGMPPALVHREATGKVEEVALSGVPLGSPMDFPYSLASVDLEAGDSVLLMSDGLPELRGVDGVELGYQGVEEVFRSVVGSATTAEETVAELTEAVARRGSRELADDVTVVVLRMI